MSCLNYEIIDNFLLNREKKMSAINKWVLVGGVIVIALIIYVLGFHDKPVSDFVKKDETVTWKFNVWGKKRAFTADVEAWA